MHRVIVIGGGISGLASAWEIRQRCPGVEVIILEASKDVGGCIRTERREGFVFDHGPAGFLNRHPSTLRIARSLGLADEIVSGCEERRRRFILSDGRLRRYPDSPSTFLGSDLLSLKAKVRMLMEPAIPRSRPRADESVGAFARRRLGKEAAELMFDPVMSGIYAGSSDRLSLRATLPQMAAVEDDRRSLLVTMLRSRGRGHRGRGASPTALGSRRYVSFKGGMGSLVDALKDALRDAIRPDSPVLDVARDGEHWRVMVGGDAPCELVADAVVSAAPATAARHYLAGLDPRIDASCRAVPYAPVVVVGLGFHEADVPHPLDGFGYLIPSRERGSVLGVLWPTSIYPGYRSPDGHVLMRVVLGGERDRSICDSDTDSLMAAARAQLNRVMGIAAKPMFGSAARYPLGLPQYRVGHDERIEEMDRALARLPGLHVIGNAFRGIGLNTCTAVAEQTSRAIAKYLGSRHGVTTVASDIQPIGRPLTLVSEGSNVARRIGSSR
ncbi:MAG: protoporphyrinogen oxidase [Myxococcota bacterium]